MKFKSDIEVQAGLRDGGNDIGTAGQILSSTGSQTNWIDQSSIVASEAKLVFIECKNTSGGAISKGTPVYQTGTVGATDVIEIDVADASDEDKMAAIGLLQTDIANNAFGKVVITGELLNITTSPIDGVTPVTGDTIYVKSGGGLTLTKPTGVNFIQNIGLVGKVSGGSAGSITVSSIMRSNDVPTPLYIDHDNQILGIGTTSPSVYHKLDVNGSANFSTDIVVGRNATALSFDMNPAYDSGNYYLNLHKNQSNDGGVLLYSKPTSGSAQLDWQIVNQGTTGDLKFYAAGLAGNALVLDRETGNLQLPEYGAGTLVSDASGNITVSSGGGAGGPYLPLAGGTMTGNLFIEGASTPKITITDTTNNLEGRIRVANNYMYIEADNSDAVVSTRMVLKTDGVEALYLDGNQNATFAGAIAVQGTGDSYFTGNVGIGETSPDFRLDVSKSYTSGNGKVAKFRSGNDATFVNFDTVQVVQTDVPCLAIIETSTGTQADEQKLTFAVGDNKAIIGSTSTVTNGMSFYTNRAVTTTGFTAQGNLALHLANTGNVGIGTTSPDYTLDVNGIIRSENSSEVGTLYLGNTAQSEIPGGAIIGQRSPNYSSTGNLLFQVPTWGANTDYGLTTQMSIEVTGADTKKATISMIPFGGNVEITDALLSNQENTDIDTGAEVVAQVSITDYTAAFFDFVVKKGTNVRSGTVYACHDGTNVEFTETSTNDLGDTSDVTLSVDISGANMRLLATVTSDDWSVKSLIRAI